MEWFEPLPNQCPPDEAISSDGIFYRLTSKNEVQEDDFMSQRANCPDCKFGKKITECIARAISIWDNIDSCHNLKKLPNHKNDSIAILNLTPDDGEVLQTFKPNHYSWWRSKSFNIGNVEKAA